MSPSKDSIWRNPDVVVMLEKGIADGLSGNAIAAAISAFVGHTVSRSAILGKGDRLGLNFSGGPAKVKGVRKPHKPHKPRPPVAHSLNGVSRVERIKARAESGYYADAAAVDLEPDHSDCAVTFAQLEQGDHKCRWPMVGDQDGLYCGAVQEFEKPYCTRHCDMAYKTPIKPSAALNERRHREYTARAGAARWAAG